MSFIAREDGEHFVIPSYREVLSTKNKTQLKKDILLLSQSYGEYITLNKKSPVQYEIAFSPDLGYLLGESVWVYFNKPADLVYCEVVPNNPQEAMLVVVKDGSVYLDGNFPLENIAEELVIFLTQKNNFDIYIHGNVPISQVPEQGKFSFDAASVKSFNVLEKPVFPTLPLVKAYKLQLVEPVLAAAGIGVLPIVPIAVVIAVIIGGYFLWSYMATQRAEKAAEEAAAAEAAGKQAQQANPYQRFYDALNTPSPVQELAAFLEKLNTFMTIPGWHIKDIKYASGSVTSNVVSDGATVQTLFDWGKANDVTISFIPSGLTLTSSVNLEKRGTPDQIYPIKQVIVRFTDKMASIFPGTNNMSFTGLTPLGVVSQATFTIAFTDASPAQVKMIGETFTGMPFVLQDISAGINPNNGSLTGSITIQALGN